MIFYLAAILRKCHYQEKQLAIEILQSQLEVEKLRNKISGELHDDIGSTLSGIAMYSHLADGQMQSGNYAKAKGSVGIIQKSANEIVDKLRDLIWAINSGKDSFAAMHERLNNYGEEMCRPKNIRFKYALTVGNLTKEPGMDVSQQLYLITKQGINNAVKYSGTAIIQFEAKIVKDSVNILIADNGNGFDETVIKANGLANMQKRAEQIGADYPLNLQKERELL